MRKKHLKESTIMNKRIFDFTHDDPEEDVFPSTVVKFNLMELTADEVQELGIPFKNSLYGAYGLYRSGNGVPEVVVCDYETRRPVYTYKITVYQIQPTDDFEEIAEHFGNLLEYGGLIESTETKVELNEEFELLNGNDKDFVQKLVRYIGADDLGLEIEDYAYECLNLEEVEKANFDAWKQQLYDYAFSLDA